MTSLLIVDDKPEMQQLIRTIVSRVIDDVFECSDGSEAVAAYIALRPDWVLMDIEMKRMDGIRATKAITAEYPKAKVIIVTNHADAETRAAASAAGAIGFVSKENLVELRSLLKTDVQSKGAQSTGA